MGTIIKKLIDKNQTYINFRDSSLTRYLKDSFGGNCITKIVTCISPSVKNYQESLSSLKFGSRAKKVVNKVCIQTKKIEWKVFQDEIQTLKKEL